MGNDNMDINSVWNEGYIVAPDGNVFLKVKAKRLTPTAQTPTYGSTEAACCDLYADISENSQIAIPPHTTIKIGTGWAFQPPIGYCGLIFARSGLATKEALRPANCVGVCDNDYTGEYIVPVHNDSNEMKFIRDGERIAQLMFLPNLQAKFIEVNDLTATERGEGGFGSTGKS